MVTKRGVALLGLSKEPGHSCPRMCSGRMSRGQNVPFPLVKRWGERAGELGRQTAVPALRFWFLCDFL